MADWRRAASAFFLFLPHRPPNDFFLPRQAKFPPSHCNGRSEPPLIRISGRKTRTRTDSHPLLLSSLSQLSRSSFSWSPKRDSPFQASRHDWQSRIDLQVRGVDAEFFSLESKREERFCIRERVGRGLCFKQRGCAVVVRSCAPIPRLAS